MKKPIKYLSCLLIGMLAFTALTSCGDDNDEPGKIELSKGESSKVTVAANASSGSIKFMAAAPWSAYTSTQSRSSDGVDWIHLDTTGGSAGEVSLTFTLDRNTTGSNRTAYIIIICEDEKLVITITQTTETDSDDVEYRHIKIEVNKYDYSAEGFTYDGTTNYELTYVDGLPVHILCAQKQANASDSYWQSDRTTIFTYYIDGGVMVSTKTAVTYYPSGTIESGSSQHYAELKDGRVVKGWYKWDDEDRADWEATYDNAGYLASTKNNDGTSTWDTYTYSWKNGCLEKIVWTADKKVVFTYADSNPNLENLHSTFDLNWVLPTGLECYDFAAGDITRMFAATGLMGNSSNMLLTAITEYTDDNHEYSYRMNYKMNTADQTVVTVMELSDNIQTAYTEWTIEYTNIK